MLTPSWLKQTSTGPKSHTIEPSANYRSAISHAPGSNYVTNSHTPPYSNKSGQTNRAQIRGPSHVGHVNHVKVKKCHHRYSFRIPPVVWVWSKIHPLTLLATQDWLPSLCNQGDHVIKRKIFSFFLRSRCLPSGMDSERMRKRYTASAHNAVEIGQQIADDKKMQPEHLLCGLLANRSSFAAGIAQSFGLTLETITGQFLECDIIGEIGSGMSSPMKSSLWNERSQRVFALALRASLINHCQAIGDEHLLLGIVAEATESKGSLSELLVGHGADYQSVEQAINHLR